MIIIVPRERRDSVKINTLVTVVLVSLVLPAAAFSEPLKTGAYMSGFIGATVPKDINVDTEDYTANKIYNDRVEMDPGLNIGMTGGYNFGFFRLEGELSYKYAEMKEITDLSDNYRYRNVSGDIGVLAMMINGFFDIRNDSPITPYFGGGVGYATIYLSDTYGTNTRGGFTTRDLLYSEDLDSVLAYQLGGGVEISLNSVLSLDLGYRYFGTSKAELGDDWGGNSLSELKVRSHNAGIGLRVKF